MDTWDGKFNQVLCGDVIEVMRQMPDDLVDSVVTSPPYFGLRDYGVDGQIGLESRPEYYVCKIADVMDEIARILKPTGTAWLLLGDTYMGDSPPRKSSKEAFSETWDPSDSAGKGGKRRSARRDGWIRPKQLGLVPARVAIELQERGWIVRNQIIVSKRNYMPTSVKDRLACSYEICYLLVRQRDYFFDLDAVREPHKTKLKKPNGSVREADNKYGADHDGLRAHDGSTRRSQKPAPLPSQSGPFILKGKNPGDTVEVDASRRQFDKRWRHESVSRSADVGSRAGLYHPKGRNPGDAIGVVEGDHTKSAALREQSRTIYGKHRLAVEGGRVLGLAEGGKNPGDSMDEMVDDYMTVTTQCLKEAHYAPMPVAIVERAIRAGCPEGGIVLDMFMGSGTVGMVAVRFGRRYLGVDLNPEYVALAKRRIAEVENDLPRQVTDPASAGTIGSDGRQYLLFDGIRT